MIGRTTNQSMDVDGLHCAVIYHGYDVKVKWNRYCTSSTQQSIVSPFYPCKLNMLRFYDIDVLPFPPAEISEFKYYDSMTQHSTAYDTSNIRCLSTRRLQRVVIYVHIQQSANLFLPS